MYNIQDMYINCINRKLAYSIRKYQGKTGKSKETGKKQGKCGIKQLYSIVIASISTEITLFGGVFIPLYSNTYGK